MVGLTTAECAALSKMTGYTYESYEHDEPMQLEPWWWEDSPSRLWSWYEDQRDNDKNYHD